MTLFWNRKGEPIEDVLEWAPLYEDTEYRNVAVDVDDTQDMQVMVSTIWEGVASPPSLVDAPIGIFESAVLFDGQVDQRFRSDTEEAALAVHRELCHMFLAREPDNGEVRQEILRREAEARAATRGHQGE